MKQSPQDTADNKTELSHSGIGNGSADKWYQPCPDCAQLDRRSIQECARECPKLHQRDGNIKVNEKPLRFLLIDVPTTFHRTVDWNPSISPEVMAAEVAQAYRIHLNTRGPTTAEGISQNLALETIPKPIARDGQILVQMKAVALNFRDLLVATDDERYQLRTVPPLVPCVDGAGIVSSVSSSSSSRWKVGDRVLLVGNTTWKSAEPGSQGDLIIDQTLGAGDIPGMLQQYMAVDEDGIVLAPKGLSFEEVACLGAAYGTAWNALYGGQLPLKKGDVVVAQGTGGVSTAVLQVCLQLLLLMCRADDTSGLDRRSSRRKGDCSLFVRREARGCEETRRRPWSQVRR